MVKNRVFHYLEPKAAGLVLFAVFGGAECRAFAAAPHKFLRAAQRQWRSEVTPADRRLIRKADTALACLKLTEDFSLKKLAVDISGAPYVIIDNSTLYDNSPVDSTDTASVQGVPDPLNMAYEWTISPNINNLSTLSGAPNTLPVDGAGPEGAGNITCVAYSNGTNQSGSKQVTVQDEYVVEETSSNVPGQMSSPLLAQFGPFNNGGTTAAKVQVSQSKTVSQTVTVGFTESAGAADGPIEAKFGLSASTSATISGTISVDTTLTVPPMTSDTLQEFPSTDTDTGTYQIWGISGLLQSGTWVYVQLAPGPMPAAQTIVQEPYSP